MRWNVRNGKDFFVLFGNTYTVDINKFLEEQVKLLEGENY